MTATNLDIYLTGVGGQGILTIAELITRAAEAKGITANFFPTKGMAQRGGFVKAQLKLGHGEIGPDIRPGGAHLVISMELCESLKAVRFLKAGGDFIVFGYKWLPTEVMLGKAAYPTVEQIKEEVLKVGGRITYLPPEALPADAADNIYLLAAAQKYTCLGQLLTADELRQAIVSRWPKGAERNMASFEAGMQAVVG